MRKLPNIPQLKPIDHHPHACAESPELEGHDSDQTISEFGLNKLILWEGTVLKPYHDVGGKLTIGVGHLLTNEEIDKGEIFIDNNNVIPWRDGITEEQARMILRKDLIWAEDCLDQRVKVPLTQGQHDALISFIFNVGCTAFANSTLLRLLNEGNYAAVPGQLRRWNKVNGQVVAGLVNRRKVEIMQWNT